MPNDKISFLDLVRINKSFDPELSDAVRRVVASGSYLRAQETAAFEASYKSYIGTQACVGVGNGFDALHLIFRAWIVNGILREGDEVLVPANTYIASILAVTESGLRPVLIEPDPRTMNIDVAALSAALSDRTRVLLAVHLYGRNAVTPELSEFVSTSGLLLVEDNAQAAGCGSPGRRTGSLGHAAAHSFYPTKNLGALGDAGAVTTDDLALADTIRTLGNYGSPMSGHTLLPGVNSRLDEIQAAVLRVKLQRLDSDNDRRRSIAEFYMKNIQSAEIELPETPEEHLDHVWHLFVVRCARREALRQHLAARGIDTLIHYPIPPHKQPSLREFGDLSLPRTEALHREVLSLPLNPSLQQPEIDRIVEAISTFSNH